MTKPLANVLACIALFIAASSATSLARRIWVDLIIADQAAAQAPGVAAPAATTVWLAYLCLFIAIGLGLAALLRTARPLVWACAFGTGYAVHWLYTSDVFLLYSGTKLYARLAIECVAPVAGCVLGALGSRWFRWIASAQCSNPTAARSRA